jgi:hypothetical protein
MSRLSGKIGILAAGGCAFAVSSSEFRVLFQFPQSKSGNVKDLSGFTHRPRLAFKPPVFRKASRRQSQPGYLLALRRKSRRIPRPPRPKRSWPGDLDERRSADSPGISLYVQDNERNNQQLRFSASIPQTRRKEELGDRRRGTFPKELPRTEPKTPLIVVVNLWFLTFAPAVAIPRSGLRFLAPG